MKILRNFSLRTVISTGLTVALLGTAVGCTVVGPGYDNYPIYRGDDNSSSNRSFNSLSQQLRQNLQRKGYQVMDIKPDNYRGNRSILAYAKKNNQVYELRYSYPDLKLISSSKRDYSNDWQDDKHKKQHKNNKHNNKHDNKGKHKKDKHYKYS